MSSAGQALDSIDDEEEQPRSSTLAEEGQAGGRRAGRPVARPMGVEGLGVIALSGSGQLSAEELQVESDLRARLNELLVLTKEGTVDAVTGLGGLLTRDNDPGGGGGGGLQAGEQRVRAHRQSVYGLTREPPPWAVQPGAPTTSAKIARLTTRVGRIRQGSSLTAEEVVGGRQLHSKVAIVTGANSGLGYETARVLCKAGARVILACRSVKSAEAAADKIRKELEDAATTAVEIIHDSDWVGANYVDVGTVEVMELDLADLDSVRSFAEKFLAEECPLHYLICNAGKMAPPFRQTKQGYETQWAINHLGHFLLSTLLTDKLDETAGRTEDGSRLVVLTSQSHQLGKMHWDRGFLNSQRDYDPWAAYFQSKLANVLFVREFDRLSAQRSAEKHGGDGQWPRTTAHAVNPGLTNTSLTRELSAFARAAYFGGMARRSAAVGAATTLYCCVSKAHDLVLGGRYYENCDEVLLWDEFEDEEDEEDAKEQKESTAQPEGSDEGVDEALQLGGEDETSLEAAARLWAISEWMVQPNSTYHDAHSGLFSVDEVPEEESFEKVFNYEVVTPANAKEGVDGTANSTAFGEAAGEWQEAEFDPTAAQRAAAEAAAARKSVGRSGSSNRGREKHPAPDDGVELAELSPADTGGTPRRAAVLHTPVIEPIDPLARRADATPEAVTKNSNNVAAATGGVPTGIMPMTSAGNAESTVSAMDDDKGIGQSPPAFSESPVPALEATPKTQAQPEVAAQATQQRMAWSALTDEERAAAVVLGWGSDGVSWEQGKRPGGQNQSQTAESGNNAGGTGDGTVVTREWRKLSPAEQAAGSTLGFDQASWDEEMAPEVAEAKAKAKAAADEAVELAMLARAAKEDAELARESRRAEAAKKEEARAARKAKVAAAKAQRKALKAAEETERRAADAARKVKKQQDAEKSRQDVEKSRLKAKNAYRAKDNMSTSSEHGVSGSARLVDLDQADAEGKQQQEQLQDSDKLNEQENDQTASPTTFIRQTDAQSGGSTTPVPADAEAALDAQAKAAFAALAAAVSAGPGPTGDGDSDALSSNGTPVRTPGRSGRSGVIETPSPSGSPADEKKQAVVAAKADYFFGQAMKLHDEFAAIERRSGARKLSYFEASTLAADLGLSLSGPALNAAIPKLDPGRLGEIRFADFEEWWKAAALQAGNSSDSTGKTPTAAGGGAKSGASKNSLGSAIALALAEEGGFVE